MIAVAVTDITNGTVDFTVFGVDQTVAIPSDFVEGDTLVVLELPYGSFVPTQPTVDVAVNLDISNLADLNAPLNVQTQGGFVFGNTPVEETDGSDDPIYEDIASDSPDTISPQLVTLTKNYLGPESETATGPNFVQQYEIVVDIAEGQTITNLDVTDILPDTMQFVDVASITTATGNPTVSNISTPDDGGLTSIGSTNTTENDVGGDGVPLPGGTLTRRFDSVTGTAGDRDIVIVVDFFVPRLDANGDVIINANSGDDILDENQSELGDNNTSDGNNLWTPIDGTSGNDGGAGGDTPGEVFIPRSSNDNLNPGTEDDPNNPNDPDHILEEQSIAIQKGVANIDAPNINTPGNTLEYTLEFQISDYSHFLSLMSTS